MLQTKTEVLLKKEEIAAYENKFKYAGDDGADSGADNAETGRPEFTENKDPVEKQI